MRGANPSVTSDASGRLPIYRLDHVGPSVRRPLPPDPQRAVASLQFVSATVEVLDDPIVPQTSQIHAQTRSSLLTS